MDWDDEEYVPPSLTGNAKTSWDDEDAEEEEAEVTANTPPPAPQDAEDSAPVEVKKKGKELAAKIREREEREALRASANRSRNIEEELKGLSDVERKLKLQQIVEDADLQNTRDTFDLGDNVQVDTSNGDSLDKLLPKTDAEFQHFAQLLSSKLDAVQKSSTKARFLTLMKEVLRVATVELTVDDVKDLTAHMNVLANEKLQVQKAIGKKGKKAGGKKTTVKMERTDLDDFEDTYDDFM